MINHKIEAWNELQVFQVWNPLSQNCADDVCGNHAQSNSNHKNQVGRSGLLFLIMVKLRNRKRARGHFKLKVRIVWCASKNSFIHELRVERCHILRRGIDKAYNFVLKFHGIGLVDQIASKPVWDCVLVVAHHINIFVKTAEVVKSLIG